MIKGIKYLAQLTQITLVSSFAMLAVAMGAPTQSVNPVTPKTQTKPTEPGLPEIPEVPSMPPVAEIPGKPTNPPAIIVPNLTKTKKMNILGWKEWVWVLKPELVMRAKLDTGARTCSIHASNIEQVEIDGKRWVKFTISDPRNPKSIRLRHKAPLLRIAQIKNDTGGLDERYVVPLTVKLGKRKVQGEFTLNNRESMTCAMLIGRNLLQELGAVDASRTYLLEKPARVKHLKGNKKPKSSNKKQ